eukprot:1356313-Prymnesium_polylepis.2
MFQEASLTSASYIFTEGMTDWAPASNFDITGPEPGATGAAGLAAADQRLACAPPRHELQHAVHCQRQCYLRLTQGGVLQASCNQRAGECVWLPAGPHNVQRLTSAFEHAAAIGIGRVEEGEASGCRMWDKSVLFDFSSVVSH